MLIQPLFHPTLTGQPEQAAYGQMESYAATPSVQNFSRDATGLGFGARNAAEAFGQSSINS